MKSEVYRIKVDWGGDNFPKRGLVISVSKGEDHVWCVPFEKYQKEWSFLDYLTEYDESLICCINLTDLEKVPDEVVEMKKKNLYSCNVVFLLDRELTDKELLLTEQLLMSLECDEIKSTHDGVSNNIRVDYDRIHPKYVAIKHNKEIGMKGFTVQESLDIYTKIINNL